MHFDLSTQIMFQQSNAISTHTSAKPPTPSYCHTCICSRFDHYNPSIVTMCNSMVIETIFKIFVFDGKCKARILVIQSTEEVNMRTRGCYRE